ncbi:MAG: hypothetical protein KAH77_07130 [Thiomargarita sp.]|nr:hypothetical protein [Thiomargarita sp.]
MSTLLQKWQKKLESKGEEFYFARELGRGDLFEWSMHMLFISNKRFIFLKKGFVHIQMVSIVLSQINALRLVKKTRPELIAFGFSLCVLGMVLIVLHAKLNSLLTLSTLFTQLHGFILLGLGVCVLMLSKIWLKAQIVVDINGLPAPLKLPWLWGDDLFVMLTKHITYYLNLEEESHGQS